MNFDSSFAHSRRISTTVKHCAPEQRAALGDNTWDGRCVRVKLDAAHPSREFKLLPNDLSREFQNNPAWELSDLTREHFLFQVFCFLFEHAV